MRDLLARFFSGAGTDWMLVGDKTAIDITGTAITICCLVRFSGFDRRLVTKWGAAAGADQYLLDTGGSNIRFGVGTGADTTVTGTTTLKAGVWYVVAGRKNGDGAGSLTVWVNGVQDNSAAHTGSIQNTTSSLRLGADAALFGSNHSGDLAEVGIWDSALLDAELLQLANYVSPLTIQKTHLMGYWPLCGTVAPEPNFATASDPASIQGSVPASGHPTTSICGGNLNSRNVTGGYIR